MQFENFQTSRVTINHELHQEVHMPFFIYDILSKITHLLCFHINVRVALYNLFTHSSLTNQKRYFVEYEMNRECSMAARGYKFYLQALRVSLTSECNYVTPKKKVSYKGRRSSLLLAYRVCFNDDTS